MRGSERVNYQIAVLYSIIIEDGVNIGHKEKYMIE